MLKSPPVYTLSDFSSISDWVEKQDDFSRSFMEALSKRSEESREGGGPAIVILDVANGDRAMQKNRKMGNTSYPDFYQFLRMFESTILVQRSEEVKTYSRPISIVWEKWEDGRPVKVAVFPTVSIKEIV